MKGIVMELRKSKMVIMKDDGAFIETGYIKGAQIGEEVDITERAPVWSSFYRYASAAAVIMMLFTGGLQVNAYYTPYGYMNVDINPSVQVEFNKFDRIIGAKGLNQDGQKVIADAGSLKNLKVEDGVAKIVETADKDEYLKADVENDIMVSTYSEDQEEAKDIDTKVNKSIQNYLNSSSKKAEVLREIVNKEDFDKAAFEGISVGKLILYRRAMEAKVDITLEGIKTTPVRDIVKMINEKRKADKQIIKDEKKTDNETEEAVEPSAPQDPKQDSIKGNQKNNQNKISKTDKNQKSNEIAALIETEDETNLKNEGIASESQTKAKGRMSEIRERIMMIFGKIKR